MPASLSVIALFFWESTLCLKVGRAKAESCAPLFLWKLFLFQEARELETVNSPNAENQCSGRKMALLR